MIDERRESQASLYALGALPSGEVGEFERAMREDLQLQLLVTELRGTADAMVATYPRTLPSPTLKSRIFATLEEGEGKPAGIFSGDPDRPVSWIAWMPWALAACFAVLCVALIAIGQSLRERAVNLDAALGERTEEATDLRRQIDLLQAHIEEQGTNYHERLLEVQKQVLQRVEELNRLTATTTNQLKQQQAETHRQMVFYRDQANQLRAEKKVLEEALSGLVPGATERLSIARMAVLRPTANTPADVIGASVWSPADQRGLLVLENLPPLPPNQSYQLWLIDPKLPAPASGGVLPPNAAGAVRLQFSTQSRIESVERFQISIEPRGGVAAPTGKTVVSSN
jgi:anti-sigma-K factor RskA